MCDCLGTPGMGATTSFDSTCSTNVLIDADDIEMNLSPSPDGVGPVGHPILKPSAKAQCRHLVGQNTNCC